MNPSNITPTNESEVDQTPVAPDASIIDRASESDSLDTQTANALQNASTGRSVAKATAGVGLMHALRFVIGFVAQPLIAHNLGLKWQADVYAVSTDIIQRLWLIWEKVINPAFLPCFIGAMKEEGEERAWRFASTAVMLTAISLLIATPLAYFGMPQLVGIYSPNAKPVEFELTVQIARLLLASLFFLGMSSLTYTILNGYKRFAIAALGDTFWKLGAFGGAFFAFRLYGARITEIVDSLKNSGGLNLSDAQLSQAQLTLLRELEELSGKALLWIVCGLIVGSLFKLLPHLLAIGRKWKMLRPRIDWHDPLTKKMLLLAVPLLCGILISEARGVYLQRLADDPRIQIEAGRAALKWSRIIGDNLIQIFPYALSIGIFPYLADMARQKDRQPLTDTLMGALRVCIFTFGPLTAILIALRFPLLRAVWESGRLSEADTIVMSGPFIGFTIGLIAFSCEMMLNQTFYALTRAWTPTLIGISMSAVWVAIASYGVHQGWGLAAIAASESISKTLKCLIMWLMLRPHLGDVKAREMALFAFKVLLGALLAAFAAGFIVQFIAPESGAARFKLKMLLAVAASGSLGVLIFVTFAGLTGIREVQQVLSFSSKIRRRLKRS